MSTSTSTSTYAATSISLPSGDLGGIITQDSVLATGNSYTASSTITISSGITLSVEPGVIVIFSPNTQLQVDGSLNIQGTATSPVLFRAISPFKGNWQGIIVGSTSVNVTLDYAIIEHAREGIRFDNAGGEIHNSIIRTNQTGIYVTPNSAPQITNNNQIYNNNYGIYALGQNQLATNPNPVVTANSIYNNATVNYYTRNFGSAAIATLNAMNNWWGSTIVADIESKLYHRADTLSAPTINYLPFLDSENGSPTKGTALVDTWIAGQTLVANTVYDVISNIVIPAGVTMNVPSGVTFKIYGVTTSFRIDGSLNLQGTATNPVLFRGISPFKGNWQGIIVGSTSNNVILNYAIIEHAREGIRFDNAGGEIHNSIIRTNQTGIYVTPNSAPQITNNNHIYNNNYGIYVLGQNQSATNPTPVATGNSIYNNSYFNYYVRSFGNAASVTLDASNNWWGSTDLATVNGKIYDSNDTLSAPTLNIAPILLVESTSAPPQVQVSYVVVNTVSINETPIAFDSIVNRYFTLNSVTNVAGDTIRGASRLVVKNSSLAVLNADGVNGLGEPFFDISSVPDFDLATGLTTEPDVRIEFENINTPFTVTLRYEVVDTDGDGISDAYESQVGFDSNAANSTPDDFDNDGVPDVINNLVGTWTGPCNALGGGEYAQEVLVIFNRDFRTQYHSANTNDCQSRWLTVSNAYTYSLGDVGNIGLTGAGLDLTLEHIFVSSLELAVVNSLNAVCTKQDFSVTTENIADGIQCEGGVLYPIAGIIHYELLLNSSSIIKLGNRLDIIDQLQRAVDLDAAEFIRTAP